VINDKPPPEPALLSARSRAQLARSETWPWW